MIKISFYGFLVVAILVTGLLLAPLLVSVEPYKERAVMVINDYTGLETQISGKTVLSLFPTPKITFNEVSIKNKLETTSPNIFYTQTLVAKPSILSLLTAKVKITEVSIVKPLIELEDFSGGKNNYSEIIQNLEKNYKKSKANILDTISIVNGSLSVLKGGEKKYFNYINTNIKADVDSESILEFTGNFNYQANKINFQSYTKKIKDKNDFEFDLNLISKSNSLNINGTLKDEGEGRDFAGKLILESNNLKSLTQTFFPNNSYAEYFNEEQKIKITSDLSYKYQMYALKNLLISSPSINGKGSIEYSGKGSGTSNWEVDLNIFDINLDKVLTNEQKIEELQNSGLSFFSNLNIEDANFELQKTTSGLFKFVVDEIKYKNQMAENFSLLIDVYQGKLNIEDLSIELPGQSKFEFIGQLEHNQIRPVIEGRVSMYGKNFHEVISWFSSEKNIFPEDTLSGYTFNLDLSATSRRIDLNNIRLSIDGFTVDGNLSYRPDDITPSLETNLQLKKFNFDYYSFHKNIYHKVQNFINNLSIIDIESTKIKNLKMMLTLVLSGEDIVFNKNNISNVNFNVVYEPSILSISKLNVISDKLNFTTDAKFDFKNDDPKISLNLIAKNFDVGFFQNENFKKKINKKKDEFNFFGLNKFIIDSSFKFKKLKYNNFLFKSVDFTTYINKNSLSIETFKGYFYNSAFVIKGGLNMGSTPSLSSSFAFKSLRVENFLKAFNQEQIKSKGELFLTGSLKTVGYKPSEWFKQLESDIKLTGRNFSTNGFNLNGLIKQSPKLFSVIDMKQVVNKSLKQGRLGVTYFKGIVNVKNRILQARDFRLITPLSRGNFASNLSLKSFDSKSRAVFYFQPEENIKTNIILDLSGNVFNPKKEINTQSLERFIINRIN